MPRSLCLAWPPTSSSTRRATCWRGSTCSRTGTPHWWVIANTVRPHMFACYMDCTGLQGGVAVD